MRSPLWPFHIPAGSDLKKPVVFVVAISTAIITLATTLHILRPAPPAQETGRWKQDRHGRSYQNPDGSFIAKRWATIRNKEYYFDENGYVVRNQWINGSYLGADGVKSSSKTHSTPQVTMNSKDSPPSTIKNANWQHDSNGTWYKNPDGSYPTKKWEEIDDQWYYFNDKGYILTNQWIGDYYVGEDGAMLTDSTTPDNYVVDSKGKWVQGINRDAVSVINDALRHSLSRAKLMKAMQHRHIPEDEAVKAVDSVPINFYAHAQTAAKNLASSSPHSTKDKLIKHLTTGLDDKQQGLLFTKDEAVRAVDSLGIK